MTDQVPLLVVPLMVLPVVLGLSQGQGQFLEEFEVLLQEQLKALVLAVEALVLAVVAPAQVTPVLSLPAAMMLLEQVRLHWRTMRMMMMTMKRMPHYPSPQECAQRPVLVSLVLSSFPAVVRKL